ncbi:MAG: hypothetical protein ACK4K7_10915 [Allosphingosinicella sp.]|uniref:hypothetical protein n=1 Tax=Allosphingosinicella sp. TaxID=2823234 RepID=UPI00396245F7
MSLDAAIDRLTALRAQLGPDARAELSVRGGGPDGPRIGVAFDRPQTAEEEARDARYAAAYREARAREMRLLGEALGGARRRSVA